MICERCGAEFMPQTTETLCASCVGKALQKHRVIEIVHCVDCGVEFSRQYHPKQPKCKKCRNRANQQRWRDKHKKS